MPPSPGDPAAEIRAAQPRAEEGVGGRRGPGERDQRESESSERWGDSRGAPEREQEGTAGGRELEKKERKTGHPKGERRKGDQEGRNQTEVRGEVKKVES